MLLVAAAGIWGFALGLCLMLLLLVTNPTINGDHSYLYPLIPFDGRACLSVFFRVKKKDVATHRRNFYKK